MNRFNLFVSLSIRPVCDQSKNSYIFHPIGLTRTCLYLAGYRYLGLINRIIIDVVICLLYIAVKQQEDKNINRWFTKFERLLKNKLYHVALIIYFSLYGNFKEIYGIIRPSAAFCGLYSYIPWNYAGCRRHSLLCTSIVGIRRHSSGMYYELQW